MGVNPITDDSEWSFSLGMAASCICEEARLASLLENSKLDDLGYILFGSEEHGVIERLLLASQSWWA